MILPTLCLPDADMTQPKQRLSLFHVAPIPMRVVTFPIFRRIGNAH